MVALIETQLLFSGGKSKYPKLRSTRNSFADANSRSQLRLTATELREDYKGFISSRMCIVAHLDLPC
jgi:hypothetical protein